LKKNPGVKLEQIKNIPGIEKDKLDFDFLLNALQERGLVENIDGNIRLVDRDD
jgi:hypothetical protein